jgi:hypothetical protein
MCRLLATNASGFKNASSQDTGYIEVVKPSRGNNGDTLTITGTNGQYSGRVLVDGCFLAGNDRDGSSHQDTIQSWSSFDVVISNNYIGGSAAGLIASNEGGVVITNMQIVNNYFDTASWVRLGQPESTQHGVFVKGTGLVLVNNDIRGERAGFTHASAPNGGVVLCYDNRVGLDIYAQPDGSGPSQDLTDVFPNNQTNYTVDAPPTVDYSGWDDYCPVP